MAGNLASNLSKMDNPEYRQEAVGFFAIEEEYFRNGRMYRDLAISLVNQLIFFKRCQGITLEDAEKKLRELQQIIRENNLRDIGQAVQRMGLDRLTPSSGKAAAKGNAEEGTPEWVIERIVELDGRFAIDKITCEEGVYRAECKPAEPSQIEQELMTIFFIPDRPFKMQVTLLCRPALSGANTAEKIAPFIEWWNREGFYELSWHEKDRILRAVLVTASEDLSEIASRYAELQKLWNVDKLAVQSAALGIFDFEQVKKHKEKKLRGE